MTTHKTAARLVAATALAGFLAATPALAQDAIQPQDAPAATTPDTTTPATPETMTPAPGDTAATTTVERFITVQAPDDWVASDMIGSTVYSTADENLGNVNDILADSNGEVKAIVVGVGGFLGIGEKNVAVNPDILQRVADGDNWTYRLETTRDELNAAPEFRTAEQVRDQVDPGTTSTVPGDPATPLAPAAPAPADPATPAPATP